MIEIGGGKQLGLKPKVMQTKVKGTSIVINKKAYASAVVDAMHS